MKKYLLFAIIFLGATDLAILLDAPGRQVLGFLFLMSVPGMLILTILKLHRIEFLKKILISLGLSIAFLIFSGLIVNSFYPLIDRPLSLGPLLIAFNIMVLLLLFLAYWRNRRDFNTKDIFNIRIGLHDKLTSPMLFSALFPFLSFFGTYQMNTQGNDLILLIMLGLIPLYIIVLIIFRHKIAAATYSVAIGMIAISLILMHSLTSDHIMGRDIFGEYYVFQLTANNAHWSASIPSTNYNACLSITILPTVFQVFLGMGSEDILRLVLELPFFLVPLIVYVITKNYLGQFYGFVASALFMFQLHFIQGQQLSGERYAIALLFFGLVAMLLLDKEINGTVKRGLFLVFSFSVVVSHYSSGYMQFFWIFLLWTLLLLSQSQIRRAGINKGPASIITWNTVLLTFAFLFFWNGLVTRISLVSGVDVIQSTIEHMANFLAADVRHETVGGLIGIGVGGIAGFLNMFTHDAIILLIGVGVLHMLGRHGLYTEKGFQHQYLISAFIFFGFLIIVTIVPYVSTAYDPSRIFSFSLFFLAPAFIVGSEILAKAIRRLSWLPIILCVLLTLQFTCVTSLQWHFFGVPMSPYYETAGSGRDEYYIYDGELAGARWLAKYGAGDSIVYADWSAWTRLLLGWKGALIFKIGFLDERISSNEFKIVPNFTDDKPRKNDYVYLRHVNVRDQQIYLSQRKKESLSFYSDYFVSKNKIYANGDAEVWSQ